MDDDKMKEIVELLAANNLRKALEENNKVVNDRGFTVGARVKCKKASWFNAKGFIVSVSDDKLELRWEKEDGSPCQVLPTTATKSFSGDKWLVSTTSGMEELRLWGTR